MQTNQVKEQNKKMTLTNKQLHRSIQVYSSSFLTNIKTKTNTEVHCNQHCKISHTHSDSKVAQEDSISQLITNLVTT